jgi:hypothetical protein
MTDAKLGEAEAITLVDCGLEDVVAALPALREHLAQRARTLRQIAARFPGRDRLAATGFGQFQPLDPGDDEIAFRRNRRIELKLTQR